MLRVFVLAAVAVVCLFGHALPTPIVRGPLRVRGNALLDASGLNVELTGVNVPITVVGQAGNDVLFKVIRRRWNLNAVRLPVSVSDWLRDGELYISAVTRTIHDANNAD